VAAIRPENVSINPEQPGDALQWQGVLRHAMFTGRELQLSVELAGHGLIEALVTPNETMMALQSGQALNLAVKAADVLYFAAGERGALLQ
jgi:iron(III) transport system ATP-binding protein